MNTRLERARHLGIWLAVALAAAGCHTVGRPGDGTIMIGEHGEDRPVTPEEIEQLSGVDRPYFVQVGDVLNLDFKIRSLRAQEAPWDYKIEVGDSMEVRFGPGSQSPGEYKLEVGDVIGISFLDNWQMNVTRTVRPDGMITAPEVGDVLARGKSSLELREELKRVYAASGIIEGEPRITVNVDFVNLDRYENYSRDIVVRPDGKINLPGMTNEVAVAGLTVQEAQQALINEVAPNMMNQPQVNLILFPAVDTTMLGEMSGALQVRPDGRISVPRVGDLQVAGYSTDEIVYSLRQLCDGLIHNPMDISVDVLKATGGRIYVGGEVNNPGVYPLEGAPTALQAVFTANGFTDLSKMSDVVILRRNPNGKPYVFRTNLKAALTKGHTENDILLRPFDTVYVPKTAIAKLNLFVEQYIENMVPFDNSLGINAQYYMNEQQVDSKSRNFNFNTGVTGLVDVLTP